MEIGSLFDVKDKVVLVTGGAKGIGRMISEGFVRNGARVYISSRDAKACEQACEEMNKLGKGKAFAIPANFYEEKECKRLAEELGKREESELFLYPWARRDGGEGRERAAGVVGRSESECRAGC